MKVDERGLKDLPLWVSSGRCQGCGRCMPALAGVNVEAPNRYKGGRPVLSSPRSASHWRNGVAGWWQWPCVRQGVHTLI